MDHIPIPVLDEKNPNGFRVEKQPILLPHRIMSHVFDECQLDIPASATNQYWDNAIASGEKHASQDSRHRVPLGLYGDAAQLVTRYRIEKNMCFFLNIVIFRPRSIRYSRFLLWSCDTKLLFKNRTINSVLRWIVWSCNALYEGVHPDALPGNALLVSQSDKDLAGTWITRQRYQFQVVEIRGDWEFHKSIWQFKSSWKGGVNCGICYRCPAMARSDDHGLRYWCLNDESSTWARGEFDTTQFVCKMLPSVNICHSILLF